MRHIDPRLHRIRSCRSWNCALHGFWERVTLARKWKQTLPSSETHDGYACVLFLNERVYGWYVTKAVNALRKALEKELADVAGVQLWAAPNFTDKLPTSSQLPVVHVHPFVTVPKATVPDDLMARLDRAAVAALAKLRSPQSRVVDAKASRWIREVMAKAEAGVRFKVRHAEHGEPARGEPGVLATIKLLVTVGRRMGLRGEVLRRGTEYGLMSYREWCSWAGKKVVGFKPRRNPMKCVDEASAREFAFQDGMGPVTNGGRARKLSECIDPRAVPQARLADGDGSSAHWKKWVGDGFGSWTTYVLRARAEDRYNVEGHPGEGGRFTPCYGPHAVGGAGVRPARAKPTPPPRKPPPPPPSLFHPGAYPEMRPEGVAALERAAACRMAAAGATTTPDPSSSITPSYPHRPQDAARQDERRRVGSANIAALVAACVGVVVGLGLSLTSVTSIPSPGAVIVDVGVEDEANKTAVSCLHISYRPFAATKSGSGGVRGPPGPPGVSLVVP